MSVFAYLYVDDKEVFQWRNDLDYSIMSLFSKDDIIKASGDEAINIIKDRKLNAYKDYEDDGENFSIMFFARRAKELKERLNVLGYSEETFRLFLQEVAGYELERAPSVNDKLLKEYYSEKNRQISELLSSYNGNKRLSEENKTKLLDILEYDSCFALYYSLKNIDDMSNVTLDVSEFAYEGWYDDSMVEFGEAAGNMQRYSSPPIVLTEGVFDRRVLKESIELLYPHLTNYIKFLDTNYKTEGGASALVKTLKSFAAAGISNRIIAIFDNDSAAHEATSALKTFSLPANYRVMHYPDIELANNYPTIGPNGNAKMNINGLAGAIELYLGEDTLKNTKGEFRQVQWTGYMNKLGKYQGELLEKSKIQQAFKDKLKSAQKNNNLIKEQDWHGIKLIIDALISNLSKT